MASPATVELGSETIVAVSATDVADAVRVACEVREAVYPVGGGTSLDYGIAPTRPGRRLDLTGLARIVDYTPRDMTIVVEAGVRMADLFAALAGEGQQLPIDVPRAAEATIGGVLATNWSGPRRLGYGTMRDYVIGIHAVDGRGVAFKGGGRVVKNVAGYDFCKLLTGSLGTVGVVTQVALKVKPLPETVATVVVDSPSLDAAERSLQRLAELPATPTAVDLLVGAAWRNATGSSPPVRPRPSGAGMLAVRIEGTEAEVAWLRDQLVRRLTTPGIERPRVLDHAAANDLLAAQTAFADRGLADAGDQSPLVLKIAVPPSCVTSMMGRLIGHDPVCSIEAHAASGIIIARFANFDSADLPRVLVSNLRPAAMERGGSVVVLSSRLEGLTPSMIWGPRTAATILMEKVKRQFDPHDILNPGRFVY